MAPKNLRTYVTSKNTPKTTLTQDRARQLGLYLDPNQSSETPVVLSEKKSPHVDLRTYSPSPLVTTSPRGHSPGVQHDVFDTDASLYDDLSSHNEEDTVELLEDRNRVGHRSHRSVSSDECASNDPAQSSQPNAPNNQLTYKHNQHSPSALRGLSQDRSPTPSSYPPTTTEGSRDLNERLPSTHSQAIDDLREWRPAYAAPSSRPAAYDISSARATGGLYTTAGSTQPTVRGVRGSRLTIVREPLVVRETLIAEPTPVAARNQGFFENRPATSRGFEPSLASAEVQRAAGTGVPLPLHHIAKSSTLGEVSDPESSPSPTDADVLDFAPDQLRAMSFGELIKGDVDDPHKLPLEAQDPSTDLEGQLNEALLSSDADRQRALLESLSLERWEEAGDWFVARLADIIKRSVDLRKDKRRLALELEKEIEKRHNYIYETRQVLEENMKGLREAGGRILEVGTPQKKRTRQA